MIAATLDRPRERNVALSQSLGHQRPRRQATIVANAAGALVRECRKQEAADLSAADLSAMLDKTYST